MRLLNVDTFKLEEFFYKGPPPPYAILSHTWGNDSEEVSYRDVLDGRLDSEATRPYKVSGFCATARSDGYQYVWIDTCCIDKTNSAELQEAINSMFRWYQNASLCYAYLADVPSGLSADDTKRAFSSSRWFQRGWTLQELLAPLNLRFYDEEWGYIGTKGDLYDLVEEITGISTPFLVGLLELREASVAQRMSWAARRATKRPEDLAYCLLGIFGISMPMIYGEGDKAFRRLQYEIVKVTGDDSILAWDLDLAKDTPQHASSAIPGAALAPAPSYFANSGHVRASESFIEVSSGSLRLPLTPTTLPDGQVVGLLKCGHELQRTSTVAIPLIAAPGEQADRFSRDLSRRTILIQDARQDASPQTVYIQVERGHISCSQAHTAYWFHVQQSVANLDLIGVHPAACWHKERALIEASVELETGSLQMILVRLRYRLKAETADFVAVLQLDSQRNPRCGLMVASRETSLEEIAIRSEAWESQLSGDNAAYHNGVSLSIKVHQTRISASQHRIILKPVVSSIPSPTVNATCQLRRWEGTSVLNRLCRLQETRQNEVTELLFKIRGSEKELAKRRAELEKVGRDIAQLREKERRLIDQLESQSCSHERLLNSRDQAKASGTDIRALVLVVKEFLNFTEADGPITGGALPQAEAAEQKLPPVVKTTFKPLVPRKDSGLSPLSYLVKAGQEQLVRLLLENGADVNAKDAAGMTALHMAVLHNREDICMLLLGHGADPAAKSNSGHTPLDLAYKLGRNIGIGTLLTNAMTPKRPPRSDRDLPFETSAVEAGSVVGET